MYTTMQQHRNVSLQNFILIFLFGFFFLEFISCSENDSPDSLTLIIMSTTDVHGWILPWDYYTDTPEERYGLAKAATLIDSIRSVHKHTLLLDAGDWLQGNPFAEYFARVDTLDRHYPFLEVADYLGYDAVVLGNHEFNFGIEYLNRQIEMTETPILGGNVYLHNTKNPAYTPYILREFGDLSVAVIGLTTPGSAVWDRPRVEGILDFGDGTEAADRFVTRVKKRGADIVIILAHAGFEGESSYFTPGVAEENFGRSIAESIESVDHLVLGHHHRTIDNLSVTGIDGREIGVIMAGRWGSHLGVSEISIAKDRKNGWRVTDQKTHVLPVVHTPPHPGIVALVKDAHEDVRGYINQPLAHTAVRWSAASARAKDTPVIDLINHVQKKVTGAQISAAAAFNTQVEFGPGPITLGHITQLYPYENTLYMLEVTGKIIREYLEYTSQYYLGVDDTGAPVTNPDWPGFNFDMLSGVEYVLDISRPVGSRVSDLMFNGSPVRDSDTFTMAVNSYRAEGGGGFDMIKNTRIIETIDKPVRDMIAEYLREKGEIQPEDVFMENWRIMK